MDAQQQDSWSMELQPPGGLLQGLTSVSMLQFLTVVLPLTVVFLLAFFLEYRAQVGADRARLLAQETSVVQRGVRRVERELEIATGDLRFVADLFVEVVEDESPGRLAALGRSLVAFMRGRPDYRQIRLIDAAGQEIVIVENTPDDQRITHESDLQDRSERSYYTGTMRLEPGELFASAMELSIERGAPGEPYEPVARLATPVDDAAGRRRGIVVLNTHIRHFLRALEQDTDEMDIRRMTVNSAGYWLQHRPEVEGGYELDDRSFQRTFPDVWAQMLLSPQGQVETSEGVFYFDSIAASLHTEAEADEQRFWMFISLVPRQLLNDVAVQVATPLLVIAVPSYFTLLVIGWFLAAALQRRRMADEALRSLEKVRSTMMTAALDGIVIMDETGTTLEFNRSARQIFGYTLEEVRGKLVADLIIPPAYREIHRVGLEHYLATGEGRIIDKHVYELTAIRKSGEEFPVELTVCPVMLSGKRLFYGFLRDLSESGRRKVEADPRDASS